MFECLTPHGQKLLIRISAIVAMRPLGSTGKLERYELLLLGGHKVEVLATENGMHGLQAMITRLDCSN